MTGIERVLCPMPVIGVCDVDGIVGQAATDAVLELGLRPYARRLSQLSMSDPEFSPSWVICLQRTPIVIGRSTAAHAFQ
jgi:hypothetical protein